MPLHCHLKKQPLGLIAQRCENFVDDGGGNLARSSNRRWLPYSLTLNAACRAGAACGARPRTLGETLVTLTIAMKAALFGFAVPCPQQPTNVWTSSCGQDRHRDRHALCALLNSGTYEGMTRICWTRLEKRSA